jgi:hypothetical protein
MNKVNLLEVYYDVVKAYKEEKADEMLAIVKKMPIEMISDLKDDALKKAGYLSLFQNRLFCNRLLQFFALRARPQDGKTAVFISCCSKN